MDTGSQRDYDWFIANLSTLMKDYREKYLIISNEAMRGAFDTFDDALSEALTIAKPGEFLIQRCVSEEENAQVVCSIMRLPNLS